MSQRQPSDSIHIATVNVRYDGQRDRPVPIPQNGAVHPQEHRSVKHAYKELPWAERRSRLVDALLATGPLDIVGFQEVYHNQLLDIAALLGSQYGYVGVGRDDGNEAGEYSPLFYNRDKFEVVRWQTIWLSPTPNIPGSKGWDANLCRIATFLTLSRLDNDHAGQLVHVINTHYDDQGKTARAESSLIIREHAAKWSQGFEHPHDPTSAQAAVVILLGDFNSPPEEDGYKFITAPHPLPSGAPSLTFLDGYTHLRTRSSTSSPVGPIPASQSRPYGPAHTYSGFVAPGKGDTARIDFIMLASARTPGETGGDINKPKGGWEVTRYACVDNWVEEGDSDGWFGRWSDHRAVRITIERD